MEVQLSPFSRPPLSVSARRHRWGGEFIILVAKLPLQKHRDSERVHFTIPDGVPKDVRTPAHREVRNQKLNPIPHPIRPLNSTGLPDTYTGGQRRSYSQTVKGVRRYTQTISVRHITRNKYRHCTLPQTPSKPQDLLGITSAKKS